jgi:PAS domain S-box-containing protein
MVSGRNNWLLYAFAFVAGGVIFGIVAALYQVMAPGLENPNFRTLFTPVVVGAFVFLTVTFMILRSRQHYVSQLAIQQALNSSEARYREIIEGTTDLVSVVDDSGNFIFVNHIAHDIFGLSPEECIGLSAFDFIHPKDRDTTMAAFQGWLREKEPSVLFENRQMHKDGTWRHMQWRIQYHESGAGEGTMFLSIARDLTDQKELEEQLRQSQKLQAIGQLTGGVAHDFNNLLAVMMGNAEMLEDKVSGDKVAETELRAIRKAVERASSLTERLLAFARQQSLSPVPVSFVELIDGLEDMLRRTLGGSIKLEVDNQADLWSGMIDPHQFENVLINLAINARDAMNGSGNLCFRSRNVTLDEEDVGQLENIKPGHYVLIAVQDDGCGMSKDLQSRVFEPFFTTKGVGQGSGLGLSMVFGFASQSGGHVAIDSEEGSGTTIKLYLPGSKED